MDYTRLPHLPRIPRSIALRMAAARAISHIEMAAANGADVAESMNQLATFFSMAGGAALEADAAAAGEPPPKPKKK